jgi:DNA invertase Pin-like site-specific DNA recombinase
LISESIKDSKRSLRRQGRHQGGLRPFGFQFGTANGTGRAPELVPDPAEHKAIVTMKRIHAKGDSLMKIRDAMRARGHQISHETVRRRLAR